MDFRKERLSCAEAKNISIVGYLAGMGFQPHKIRGNDYWYHSPLRIEHTPSFKVNVRINRWYDFGTGKGGSLIDFGMIYHNCSLPALLEMLSAGVSFPRCTASAQHIKSQAPKIIITGQRSLSAPSLITYLLQRKIPLVIAEQFCCEVSYQLNDKSYFGIGFKNNSGGYEIRNPYYKSGSSPKDFTTIPNGSKSVCVFEGFFDFLSFLVLYPADVRHYDFLILNSLAFFERARPAMEGYQKINLFLDNNGAGKDCSCYALTLSPAYSNHNVRYENYEDLNDYLCQCPHPISSFSKTRPP